MISSHIGVSITIVASARFATVVIHELVKSTQILTDTETQILALTAVIEKPSSHPISRAWDPDRWGSTTKNIDV